MRRAVSLLLLLSVLLSSTEVVFGEGREQGDEAGLALAGSTVASVMVLSSLDPADDVADCACLCACACSGAQIGVAPPLISLGRTLAPVFVRSLSAERIPAAPELRLHRPPPLLG